MSDSRQKIAVIGGGIAGISAAYLLSRKHDVTLFEKNNYVGGHTNTILVSEKDQDVPVDTGFIVFNEKTYPNFCEFLKQLGVESQESCMSFAFYDEATGFQYSSFVPQGLFAQRSNVINPKFWRMIRDILKFNRCAKKDLEQSNLEGLTLGEYIDQKKLGDYFLFRYLIPMGSAIWSCPKKQMLHYPAESFLRFFENHGLLSVADQPLWRTVVGGSQSYVKAFLKGFEGSVYEGRPIKGIQRSDSGVRVRDDQGNELCFDQVVIATHADEALKLLKDPTQSESKALSVWNYSNNKAVLHTDDSVMPSLKRSWASWNYMQEGQSNYSAGASLTYHMNRLQRLNTQEQYFVTLNRASEIKPEKIIKTIDYTHPIFDTHSIQSQAELRDLNGVNRSYFCGSYFGYGFHEDAIKSSVQVAEKFGVNL